MIRRLLAIATLVLAVQPVAAGDIGWHVGSHVLNHASLPGCDASSVLNDIGRRFAWAQRATWKTGLSIGDFDLIEETDAKLYGPSLIDRVYCRARAYLSDGRQEPVFYVIESKMGFAGHGSRVSFCLPNFDYYRVYDAWCRTVQP